MPQRTRKVAPDQPDLPSTFDDSPAGLGSGDDWECVEVTDSVSIPDVLADVSLSESLWTGVDLSLRKLTGFRCRDVVFEQCDLSGAQLDGAQLTRVRFAGCRLTGTMLSGTTLADVSIEDCNADLVNFRAARADYFALTRTSLREADFYAAQLGHSAIFDSDLSRASFTDVRAAGLELHGSTLDTIVGAQSLAGVRIDADQLVPLGAALAAAMQIEVCSRR